MKETRKLPKCPNSARTKFSWLTLDPYLLEAELSQSKPIWPKLVLPPPYALPLEKKLR